MDLDSIGCFEKQDLYEGKWIDSSINARGMSAQANVLRMENKEKKWFDRMREEEKNQILFIL